MLPDLQHLIHLQDLDSAAERCRKRIADIPAVQQSLEARSAARAAEVQAVKDRVAATGTSRRDIEKEVAGVQTRLSKYKEQLMAVKTNKEYTAMQHEIATAEGLVRSHEDRLLDLMEISEKESTDLKTAEGAMKAEQAEIAKQQKALDAERGTQGAELQRLSAERESVAANVSRDSMAIYLRVAHGRRGIALAEAKGGLCTVCHVRMRPQTFNEVRRNDGIHQCESCTRILYYVQPPAAASPQPS
ncbi:MAG: C4-type zinc ribbon domain-containing protein [Vicinamibacterales bacterium]